MNISAAFISRPIATTLLALGIALAGLGAFKILPVSPLPQIEFPTIVIKASLPGANPEVMASAVATPLEHHLSHIAGVTEMTSTSSLGNTKIILQFDLSRNIDGAARDVQAAMDAAASQLPSNLPGKPTYLKVNPSDAPIMIIALTSEVYKIGQMYDAASTILQQKLSQVDGVGQVLVGGSALPAVRIELNPTVLNKYGISFQSVGGTVAAANSFGPKGQLSNGLQTSDITTNSQIFHPNDYKSLIVGYNKGAAVRLEDVSETIDESVEDLRNAGVSNGKPAVLMVIFKQPGRNIIETVQRLYEALPFLKAAIPEAMDMTVVMDRTTTIRASIHDVEFTLILSMILVMFVVYGFFRSARAAFIPCVAVPLSLLGTFGMMYLCGYSLDNLSFMALTIATGFVVDDAVVVLENIQRHLESGLSPLKAALFGVKEVGFTVFSISISLVAVFIPILLMEGIVGRLFREFAIVLSIAILASLIISLTVTPMLCAYILKYNQSQKEQLHTHFMMRLRDIYYASSLRWVLNHPVLTLGVAIGTVVLNVYLFIVIPKGFSPQQDVGQIVASIQADQNISFQAMKEKLLKYAQIVKDDPAVRNVVGFVGGTGSAAITNTGSMYINLVPLAQRKISADAVIHRLRSKTSAIPGSNFYMQASQDLVIGGRQGNAQFQYTLTAHRLEDLNAWVPSIMEQFSRIPGVIDLNNDQMNHGLESYITIDRDTASRLGITAQQIDSTLYGAFGQSQVSTMYTLMNQYHVVMEVAPRYWQHPEILDNIYISSSSGNQVPLSAIASFKHSQTLLSINHQGVFPSATLSFNLLPRTSLGEVVAASNVAVEKLRLPSSTINGSFQGTALAFQKSLSSQPYLILATLLAVYIVLGILYESLIHPITILSTLPSAGIGALLALQVTQTDLNIIALIGMILLIGIVKKNAIMMIDFALTLERNDKKSPSEAIFEACLLRFRPIMMTTVAALLSALPLALGTGVGSELRKPLGISIIGGLLISQGLTLYTTPVIYLTFERFSKWIRAYRNRISRSNGPATTLEETV
jgi:multidrug efflux pump